MPKITAKVLNTKVDAQGRLLAIINCDKKSPDKDTTVEVEWGNTRTQQMNKLYFACLKIISDYTGHTKEELHSWCAHKFLGHKIEVLGEEFIYSPSTRNLRIDAFSTYLEDIRFYFWETLGINLQIE